ncbi:uncharacterized protein LOC107762065 isoform X1 [Nicotiana tabacum]|uniref:Uncharacterized protein LOC107762065 isoform X1 n=1 Tax=Nicotiana tabacum TaxID=4097 RepID=A0A1S3X7J6_TOBAC|nr:PREDICTED: uncharacterized protein LOC107762065 isoform X1 [Nicotiana tabacum]XP_018629040.1 uncharacterized protein LOC104104419 isoform X1 [Nicotiana tomentosiformis]
MSDSVAITASSLAITEKKPQRPGGCVGIFFQLFDWNRRFAKKKLFPKKLLSPARLKQASKKFGGDEKQPKHRLIANENSGGFPNAKNNGMSKCESKREMKAPSLIARLMGLESMPTGQCGNPKKASSSEIGSNMAEKLGARPGGSDREDMNFEKAEIKRELRPQKLQKIGLSERRPVSRFSAEALQLKTVLSRPRKHQPKLVSPVKSPRNVSGRNASRLIGAASRILEPGLQKSRAKCALTYPKYISPLEDKADLATHHLVEGSNSYVDSKTLKGTSVPSCKNCGYLLHSKNGTLNVSSPVCSYSEPSCEGPGRNMPRLPVFGSRDQHERVSEGSSSDATAEIDDVSYCAELILGKRTISRSQIGMHGTRQGSNVKKDVSCVTHVHKTQKQNQTSQNRERGLMKSKPSSLQSNRVLAATESTNDTKSFVAQNRRLGASTTRLRMPATADGCKFETERKPYSRRSDSLSPVRKKRLMNISRQGESSTYANANLGRESSPYSDQTSRKDVVFPISSGDRHSTKPKLPCLRESGAINDNSEGRNVVSFTFKSAMNQKADIHAEVTKRKSQNGSSFDAIPGRSYFKGNDETTCLQKPFPLKGDILGALLEQKLKELTSEEEFAEGGRKSTATILQELITALNAERQFHLDSLPLRPSRKEDSRDYGGVSSRNTCMNFQATLDSATNLVGNSLDIDNPSPGCVLEASFSNDSCLSSSPNSSSKDKLLAESVDSMYDEQLFPETDRDLSDCAASLFSRRSCGALITDHVNNISGVLSKIDQLKGSKLSHAKEVILNAELSFGTTPPLVDDGFSVSHFLVNELDILSSLLWMTFGQLLGCNDPKQMNQLKGFAFDCVVEYLDTAFGRYSNSGFRTWTKQPSSMTKEIMIADIIEEVKMWTEFVGLIPDELIEWDMSHSLGKWIDFDIETFECGTEVDRHILQVLVDEVVLDLYCSS